mmetsp:Transcript_1177/g.3175  ORF Transcript_1177/g.3175 Transcript_1177/m.3175 type:complete len:418 (+) Transcript_1177:116-1369(+)
MDRHEATSTAGAAREPAIHLCNLCKIGSPRAPATQNSCWLASAACRRSARAVGKLGIHAGRGRSVQGLDGSALPGHGLPRGHCGRRLLCLLGAGDLGRYHAGVEHEGMDDLLTPDAEHQLLGGLNGARPALRQLPAQGPDGLVALGDARDDLVHDADVHGLLGAQVLRGAEDALCHSVADLPDDVGCHTRGDEPGLDAREREEGTLDGDGVVADGEEANAVAHGGAVGQADGELRDGRPGMPEARLEEAPQVDLAIREGALLEGLLPHGVAHGLHLGRGGRLHEGAVAVALRVAARAEHRPLGGEDRDADVRAPVQVEDGVEEGGGDGLVQPVAVACSVESEVDDACANLTLHVCVLPVLEGARGRVPAQVRNRVRGLHPGLLSVDLLDRHCDRLVKVAFHNSSGAVGELVGVVNRE